jgi:hypothetical protein
MTRPWLAEMSQLEDGSLLLPCSPRPRPCDCRQTRTIGLQCPPVQKMLPTSCVYGNERRNGCAFQPMPMRCARLNQGLPAAEFVKLTPEPAEASVHSATPFYADHAPLGLWLPVSSARVGVSDRSAATQVRRSPAVPALVSPPGLTSPVNGIWPTRRPGTRPRPKSVGPDPDLIRGTSRTLVVLLIRGSGSGFGILRVGRWALRVWSGSWRWSA